MIKKEEKLFIDLWQAHYQIMPIIFLKELIELNVNTDMMTKKLRLAELNISIVTVFLLKYINFKGDLIQYKCLCYNKNYQHKFDEKLKERFYNTYKFSNHSNNKFILLLQNGVYSYEYMDNWEKFNETSLLEKEYFYSYLNMEDITDADYVHAKRVCKDFEIKKKKHYCEIHYC